MIYMSNISNISNLFLILKWVKKNSDKFRFGFSAWQHVIYIIYRSKWYAKKKIRLKTWLRGHKSETASLLVSVSLFLYIFFYRKWDSDQKWDSLTYMAPESDLVLLKVWYVFAWRYVSLYVFMTSLYCIRCDVVISGVMRDDERYTLYFRGFGPPLVLFSLIPLVVCSTIY